MRFNFEIISGELLLEALTKNNVITQDQYNRISDHYDDARNDVNYTLISIFDIFQFLDDSQISDVKNLVITKAEIQNINYCYIAI